jgi:hypothetical protein
VAASTHHRARTTARPHQPNIGVPFFPRRRGVGVSLRPAIRSEKCAFRRERP